MPGDGPIGQPCSCRTFHVSKEVNMNQSNIFGTRSIIKGFILIRSRHLKSIARPPALQHSVVRLKAGGGWQQKVDAGIPFLSRVLYIYEDCSQVMLGCALRCYDPAGITCRLSPKWYREIEEKRVVQINNRGTYSSACRHSPHHTTCAHMGRDSKLTWHTTSDKKIFRAYPVNSRKELPEYKLLHYVVALWWTTFYHRNLNGNSSA
jgi:hypothetical protein